jgi:hypothetical protein
MDLFFKENGMSKPQNRLLDDADQYATETSQLEDEIEVVDEVEEYDDITDDDYGFILDSDGNLKSVFLPTDYVSIPKKVYDIFALFGIDDVDEIHIRLGHKIH